MQANTKENINGLYHPSSDRSSLFGIPSKNTTFIENLKQLSCLFKIFFLLTKIKSRLWLELAWFPWQKTLDVKMSLDASKLFVQELVQGNTKKKYQWSISLFLCSLLIIWYMYPLQKHSIHCKSEADRLFVQQIFPVNINEIQTLAGIGLSPLTKDPRCKKFIGCN